MLRDECECEEEAGGPLAQGELIVSSIVQSVPSDANLEALEPLGGSAGDKIGTRSCKFGCHETARLRDNQHLPEGHSKRAPSDANGFKLGHSSAKQNGHEHKLAHTRMILI